MAGMVIESVESAFTVHVLSGLPSFGEVAELAGEMLAEAEVSAPADVAAVAASLGGRRSPTTAHLAIDGLGRPLGVATSTVGPFAELPLGLVLARAEIVVPEELEPPSPVCELVSITQDESGRVDTAGVTEALFRSVYRRARHLGARSIVAGIDPWLVDVLAERYGIELTALGPSFWSLERELLAVAGDLNRLERGVARRAPAFAEYLQMA